MLHHCGWGRHRRLCCVAITAGYGYNTLGLLLSVQRGLHTVALVARLEVHNASFRRSSLYGEFKAFFIFTLSFYCNVLAE